MIKYKKGKKLDNTKIKKTKIKRVKKDMMELTALQSFWFVTINDNDSSIVHHGKIEAGQTLATGQPAMEEYDNEADYLARLVELGVEFSNG